MKDEKLINILFDQSETPTSMVDITGRFTNPNQAFCDLFGYSKEELTQMTFDAVTLDEFQSISRAKFNQMLTGKTDKFDIVKGYKSHVGINFMATTYAIAARDNEGDIEAIVAKIKPHTTLKGNWLDFFAKNSKMLVKVLWAIIFGVIATVINKLLGIDITEFM